MDGHGDSLVQPLWQRQIRKAIMSQFVDDRIGRLSFVVPWNSDVGVARMNANAAAGCLFAVGRMIRQVLVVIILIGENENDVFARSPAPCRVRQIFPDRDACSIGVLEEPACVFPGLFAKQNSLA